MNHRNVSFRGSPMAHVNQLIPTPESMVEVRSHLIDSLERDLIGPSWKEGTSDPNMNEVLDLGDRGQPDRYYLTGYLSPLRKDEDAGVIEIMSSSEDIPPEEIGGFSEDAKGVQFNRESDRTMEASGGDRTFTSPSTMGVSVLPSSSEIEVVISWGSYTQEGKLWTRTPHEHTEVVSIDGLPPGRDRKDEVTEGVFLYLRRGTEDHPTLTVRIVNEKGQSGVSRSEVTLFQPKISLRQAVPFEDVRKEEDIFDDLTMAVLYHDSVIPAQGHNTGVDWSENVVWTTFLPSYEVPKMKAIDDLRKHVPDMSYLIEESKINEGLRRLHGLVSAYDDWIAQSLSRLENPPEGSVLRREEIRGRISEHRKGAEANARRMREGIEFLEGDELARRSFMLANAAIRFSQDEAGIPEVRDRVDEEGDFIQFKWYPFQIAFQLLNMKGLCALDSTPKDEKCDRGIVDLAWFPTGGGKTEAYLGLISMIGFYRRLRAPEKELVPSVHVIMRYTLRLLTSDQADRLVRLAVGMNHIASTMGESMGASSHDDTNFPPFRVGMWVGRKVSPRDLLSKPRKHGDDDSAQNSLRMLRRGDEEPGEGSVIQFEVCPWCGSNDEKSIRSPQNWDVCDNQGKGDFVWSRPLNERASLNGRCLSKGCMLKDGVPFTCIDEDIYLNPPSILLATVDKFVQLSNNPVPNSAFDHITRDDKSSQARMQQKVKQQEHDARTMLGFDSSGGGGRAPDLVIQDELHLLSGPLGTLSGLVETGIHVAWGSQGHRPKYIAATATIRGAEKDARLMYGRDLNIFPPPMEDANDNFFAKADTTPGKGRVHVGILGPYGKDQTLFAHTSGSLLQRAQEIKEKRPDRDGFIDPYWTLVSYFNSLRELGMAQSQLSSRIPEFTTRFSSTTGSSPRQFSNTIELTSRRTAGELKAQKAALKLEIGHGGAVDTVVTSNMFQVGIDISRLGLMIINGQPRSNSEYIQSSGRVGRKHPGMVVSLLRSKYPRDQSHYESYRSFHQEMYRHVDVTSTTPFSVRSLDRAMATVLALVMRMGIKDISGMDELWRLGKDGKMKKAARGLYRDFKRQMQERQDGVGAPEAITKEGIRSLESAYESLVQFSEDPREDLQDDKRIAHWVVWNKKPQDTARKRGMPIPRGWLISPFYERGWANGANESISSLRDVAEEIAAWEASNTRGNPGVEGTPIWRNIGSIPEGHFFSQSTPGGLWEKDGETYLTLGINQWLHGAEAKSKKALLGVSEGGQRVEEEVFKTVSTDQDLSLRLLPKRGASGSKAEHGAVTYKRYPMRDGFICSAGHISTIYDKDKNGVWRCGREGCAGDDGLPRRASPSRWVSVCRGGHLHPFNYNLWAHGGGGSGNCSNNAKIDLIKDSSASYTLEGFNVECTECGSSNTMSRVPYVSEENGPECRGWLPWLGPKEEEECTDENGVKRRLVHRQIANVSVTYSNTSSIMLLPLQISWSFAQKGAVAPFKPLSGAEEMKSIFNAVPTYAENLKKAVANSSYLEGDRVDDRFWDHLEEYMSLQNRGLTIGSLRMAEVAAMRYTENEDIGMVEDENFDCREVVGMKIKAKGDSWESPEWPVEMISRADRLTALEYITGLSRVMPSGDEAHIKNIDKADGVRDTLGIARYNHGEGIYIQIKKSWLQRAVDKRASELSPDHANMVLSSEKILPSFEAQVPSVKSPNGSNALTVLHTLSHLIIKELCGLSGYSLGSIRERLYLDVSDEGEVKTAGILLYTSGPSSDGTLGGLVSQATEGRISGAVKRALSKRDNCSNDPVCYTHKPIGDEINGAACHTCVLLPETSCELRNFFLDRNW